MEAYGGVEWVPMALSSVVKRPGREADRSSPANAEVRKMWLYDDSNGLENSYSVFMCTGKFKIIIN
jgi:hypothetical protein